MRGRQLVLRCDEIAHPIDRIAAASEPRDLLGGQPETGDRPVIEPIFFGRIGIRHARDYNACAVGLDPMKRALLASAAALLVPVIACSQPSGPSGEAPPPASAPSPITDVHGAPSRTRGPLIATLVTRDAKLSVIGGERGLRVVIRKHDGAIVADGLTLAALRDRDPALFQVIDQSIAYGEGSFVDAILDDGQRAGGADR
jgi:hypothetical protein